RRLSPDSSSTPSASLQVCEAAVRSFCAPFDHPLGRPITALSAVDVVAITWPDQQLGLRSGARLGLVRKIVPQVEGTPSHQQIVKSTVSASSAEDVANFVVVVG